MHDHLNGRQPEVGDIWFRVDDPYGGSRFGPPSETRYYVQRVTPRGVWLDYFHPRHRSTDELRPASRITGAFFVLLPDDRTPDGGRRAAYPTVALARQSWRIRKRRQRQRLEVQLERLNEWEQRLTRMGDSFWSSDTTETAFLVDLLGGPWP